MDFGGGEHGVLPFSCSLLFGESDLASTPNGIRAISGGCYGQPGCCVRELAQADKVTWQFKPPNWNPVSTRGWRLHSRVWRKSTTQATDSALLWGLHFKTRSRFFSLALDVKFASHTFLRGLFFISSPQQLEKTVRLFDLICRECLWSQIQKTSS